MKNCDKGFRTIRFLLPMLLVTLLSAMGCGGRAEYFEQSRQWSGPHVLDKHVYYLDRSSGRVLTIEPRNEEEPIREFMLAPDAEWEDDWLRAVTFPDQSHIIFVSRSLRSFYIVDDASGEVKWTIADLPIEFNSFAFSPDGRWMIGYKRNGKISPRPDHNLFGAEYDFSAEGSILTNSHTLLVLDLQSGDVSLPTLKQNDIPIRSVGFTGAFLMCANSCPQESAREMERVAVLGDSRMWLIDPQAGDEAVADVIPLSLSDNGFRPTVIRATENRNDELEDEGTVDNREQLFLLGQGSQDIVVVNMLWNQEGDRISYSINKLGLNFSPDDILPYVDGGEIHLLAVSGDTRMASIHVESARSNLMRLPVSASSIHPYHEGARSYPLLYGGRGLVMVNTVNLDVFGDKNLTHIDLGFTPETVAFGSGNDPRVVAIDGALSRMAVVGLDELKESNLTTSALELTANLSHAMVDEQNNLLMMLESDHLGKDYRRLYILPFDGEDKEVQIDVSECADEFKLMRSDDGNDLILLDNGSPEGSITALSTDGAWAHSYRGFLIGEDLF